MAKPEHLEILEQGVAIWNRWRKERPQLRPDLRGADLSELDLDSLDLRCAGLCSAQQAYLMRGLLGPICVG